MTDFKIECKKCNQAVANSNNVLARHIRNIHKIEWLDYIIEYEYGGNHPICKCGCGEKVKWAKGGFRKFIKGHDARGKNNGMFGKLGKESPNFGKKRTEEHKKKYSEAAKKRWENPDDSRREIMKSDEYRKKMKISTQRLHNEKGKSEYNKKKMKEFWDNAPSEKRKFFRDHAIRLLAEGKIGPQAPYKTEWKHNPFTDQKEYMHSSWESIFLDHMIKEGIPITKKHDYRFPYKDLNGIEREYVPDFVEISGNVIYEVKGGQDGEADIKAQAAKQWCAQNGFEYIMLYKKEIRDMNK